MNNIFDVECAYIQGAKEQHKIDIENACEWLLNYFVIEHEGMTASGCDVFLKKFRKAMEAEYKDDLRKAFIAGYRKATK